jgi:hypothetical protein
MNIGKLMITPLIIKDKDCHLYGILRYPEATRDIVIFLPAATGTRVGPQRIYVQISNHLIKTNKASFCVDLPPHGDSYDNNVKEYCNDNRQKLIQHYGFYLNKIIAYLNSNYKFENYILCSISLGCIPILSYAKSNNIKKVILLSPNLLSNLNTINKRNLKNYYYKLFQHETWLKILTFNVQYKKVFRNIVRLQKVKTNKDQALITGNNNLVHVLCIYGEKDIALSTCQKHWKKQLDTGKISKYDEKIIENADHNFFGWNFKEQVASHINKWV